MTPLSVRRQLLPLPRHRLVVRDPQHAGLLVRQRVGDELDQQVKVVARLAPEFLSAPPGGESYR